MAEPTDVPISGAGAAPAPQPVLTPPPPAGFERVPAAAPPPPPGFEPVPAPGKMESFLRGAAESATFGFEPQLGMSKEAREASRVANPWTHFMGEMAGSLAPAVVSGGVGLLGRGASLGARLLRAPAAVLAPGEISTVGQAVGQGAKLGTSYGALSGAGHADVAPDDSPIDALLKRARAAVVGGAEGAIMGPVMGLAGHGVYRAGQGIGTVLNRASAEVAPDVVGGTGITRGALVTATKNLERDRLSPQQLIDNILTEFPDTSQTAGGRRYFGPATNRQAWTQPMVEEVVRRAMMGETAGQIETAMAATRAGQISPGSNAIQTLLDELAERHLGPLNLVDRAAMARVGSGENTQMSMRAAAATPGEHLGIARENLLERQIGAQGRAGQLLERTLGSRDFEGVAAGHENTMRAAANRLYDQARKNEHVFDIDDIINDWLKTRAGMRGSTGSALDVVNNFRAIPGEVDQAGNAIPLPGGTIQDQPRWTLDRFMNAREVLRDAIDREQIPMPDGTMRLSNMGRQLAQLKQDVTARVAETNPSWKLANDTFRDGMAGHEALQAGAKMSTRLNASSRENLKVFTDAQAAANAAGRDMTQARSVVRQFESPNGQLRPGVTPTAAYTKAKGDLIAAQSRQQIAQGQMDLFKVGLVRSISDRMMNTPETHNLTRELLLPGARQQLTKVLGSDAPQFFRTLEAEKAMHRTYQSQFGSQTTPLREHIDEQNWAPALEASMLNPLTWLNPGLRLVQQYMARTINARRNTDLMRLYTDTDATRQLGALRAMQGIHQARTTTGNTLGLPAITVGSGALPEATVARQYAEDEQRKGLPSYRP